MSTTEAQGTLRAEPGGRAGVRFERLYDATPDELWAALTDPEQLRGWLAEAARFDLRRGGHVELHFPTESAAVARGRILELQPGRVLEYEWDEAGGPPSVVRFELAPRGDGCLLILDHRLLDAASGPGFGAGWHGHLDALGVILAGGERVDPRVRYERLRPVYERLAAGARV